MKIFLIAAAATAVVLCLLPSETLGAKPPPKVNAVTTRKSKLMNDYASTPGYGYPTNMMPIGPSQPINPACVACEALKRTRDLNLCIKDPSVLEFFETMKSECEKNFDLICRNPNDYQSTYRPDDYMTSKRFKTTYRPEKYPTSREYRTSRNPYDYYTSDYRRLAPFQQRDFPLDAVRNRSTRNALCIACFVLARFNDMIECLFEGEELQGFEQFMQGCAQNFFMCLRS